MSHDDAQPSLWTLLQGLEFHQGYLQAGAIRTRYVMAGQGPALVMLHGNGGHLEANLRAMAQLASDFTCFAIDMVAHGYSDAPSEPVTPEVYARHVRDFLDAANIDKAHIAGVSLGARVALWTALVFPERVMSVIANTGLPLAPADDKALSEMREAQQRSLKVTEQLTRENMLARLRGVIGSDDNIPAELIDSRLRVYAQPGRADVIRKLHYQNYEDMLTSGNRPPWFGFDALRKITAPVLVVWTEQNPGHGLDIAQEAVAALPHGSLAVVANAKHWPQWENPDEYVSFARGFLLGEGQQAASRQRAT